MRDTIEISRRFAAEVQEAMEELAYFAYQAETLIDAAHQYHGRQDDLPRVMALLGILADICVKARELESCSLADCLGDLLTQEEAA